MGTAASQSGVMEPRAYEGGADRPSFAASACRQLLAELDSAVEFADHCGFLGGDRMRSRAEELVEMAQQLYDDTLSSLRDTGGPARHDGTPSGNGSGRSAGRSWAR